ncbi:MAG TPA: hypothetical protein VHT91_18165 [Kofleriaceae bacterium]|jgi:hypothetical protein|nr:hypothetical protein [Kofleriaceae bacterium]
MRPGLAAAVTMASALGAACLDIPPYRGPTKVGYSPDKTGAITVATPDVTLHFAGGSGFHLPDQLKLRGVDVLGHATSPCWAESGTGFAVTPMPRVSGDPLDGGVMAVDSEIHATMTGPVVVQIALSWSTRWSFASTSTCSTNAAHKAHGSSTFTVFPDGHIVRHDVLTEDNPDMEQIMTDHCTCAAMPSAPDAFILSSYWAFDRQQLPTQVGLGDSGPNSPDPLMLGTDYNVSAPYSTICLDGPGDSFQVASAWVVPPRAGHGPGTNAAAIGLGAVVSHDVQKLSTPMLDFPWDAHGALFFDRSNCTAVLKRTLDYTAPQPLMISTASGTITSLPSQLDGIYGGDPGAGGNAGIDVSSGTTTLSGGPSAAFVVWLRFPGSVTVPTAIRAGAPIGWYVPQQINDREWLIWVQDGLQPGETITVRPNN